MNELILTEAGSFIDGGGCVIQIKPDVKGLLIWTNKLGWVNIREYIKNLSIKEDLFKNHVVYCTTKLRESRYLTFCNTDPKKGRYFAYLMQHHTVVHRSFQQETPLQPWKHPQLISFFMHKCVVLHQYISWPCCKMWNAISPSVFHRMLNMPSMLRPRKVHPTEKKTVQNFWAICFNGSPGSQGLPCPKSLVFEALDCN